MSHRLRQEQESECESQRIMSQNGTRVILVHIRAMRKSQEVRIKAARPSHHPAPPVIRPNSEKS
jgi:hypothetical protein